MSETVGTPLLYVFDGNARPYPSLLTRKAKRQGCTETTLRRSGPDELRMLLPKGWGVKKLGEFDAHNLTENFHQGLGVRFRLHTSQPAPNATVFATIMLNSGRNTDVHAAAEITKSFMNMRDALLAQDADIHLFAGVEFGEADNPKSYDEHAIAHTIFDHDFRQFFPKPSRETLFVSRHSGHKEDDVYRVLNTAVHHQSPARPISMLTLLKTFPELTIGIFHAAAGYKNGKRPHPVWEKLGVSWRATRRRARQLADDVLGVRST